MSKELDQKEIYQKILEKFEEKDREIAELKQKMEGLTKNGKPKEETEEANAIAQCGKCGRSFTKQELTEYDSCPDCGYRTFSTL